MKSYTLYWIHLPEHTNITTQGYVGITNNFNKRMIKHKSANENPHLYNAIKKYGWDNLIKQQMVISTKDYIVDLEKKLRSADHIGWNIAPGGGIPPNPTGKKRTQEHIDKMVAGIRLSNSKRTPELIAKTIATMNKARKMKSVNP